MIYLLIGYMWLFVHRPFEVWPWLAELRIERVYMVITLICAALGGAARWTPNRVNLGVAALAAAIAVSTAFSSYTDFQSQTVQDWFKVLVFYVLLMSCVHGERDLRKLIIAFVVITGLYELHSLYEYFNGRGVYRMGTWRMIGVDQTLSDPNSFANTVNYGIPMLLPVLTYARTRWHYLGLAGLLALAITCVLLTGSRTGFVVLLFQALAVAVFSKKRWIILSAVLIALPVIWTVLPPDRKERYMTLIDPSRGPAAAATSAEGRERGFFDGIKNWRSSPFFGVGPGCHGAAIGHGAQSHNLYGQVLGETGSFGAIGLTLLLVAYGANFLEARRLSEASADLDTLFLYRVVLVVLWSAVLLLLSGWGGHNLFRYHWLWYAAFSALAVRSLRERWEQTAKQDGNPSTRPDEESFCTVEASDLSTIRCI